MGRKVAASGKLSWRNTHRSRVLKDEVDGMGRGRHFGQRLMLPKSTEARNLFSSTEQVVAKAGTKDAHNKGQETWLEREAGVREQHLKPMGGKGVSEGFFLLGIPRMGGRGVN